MEIKLGDLVKLGENGVSRFRVTDVAVDGDPGRVLVKPVSDRGYEFPTRTSDLVVVDESEAIG
ncbi:hypothetical protein OIE68_45455 [Nocardia vinacea]|uniref:hypothetical protein n=1 Tax=Nocardia vinacea TaxID=96468 RepID=UPI002E12ADB0|nr:hypothetical protein OIE68_45455 [Nocardia vinacea]